MLVSSTWALPSRNFDVPCDFNTFASTLWTQNLTYSKERHEKERLGGWKKKIISLRAGFEPAREDPIGFQVQRLNHSAITARYNLQGEMFIFKYDITSSTLDTSSHFKNQKMSEKCGTKAWLVTAKALLLTYGVEKVIQLKSTVVMVHFCLKRKACRTGQHRQHLLSLVKIRL